MAAGLVPIATVTDWCPFFWWRLGPVDELRVALQISATIAFHRVLQTLLFGAFPCESPISAVRSCKM
jgi:hypothetical protein